MKSLPFIAAIAALSLSSSMAAAEQAAEAKVVHIGQTYSKTELDAICARAGGHAYGSADDSYGCAKDTNIVACYENGSCTGYMWLHAAQSSTMSAQAPIDNWRGNAELVLQMPATVPKSGLDGSLDTAR